MFISYRLQLALSKLVEYLKGGSLRILLQEYASLKKHFGEDIYGQKIIWQLVQEI